MASHGWIRRLLPARKPPRRRPLYGCRRTESLECRTLLTAFVVTTPLDLPDVAIGDGSAVTANGETSLRAAVQEANALPGSDTVILPSGLFVLFGDDPIDVADDGALQSGLLTVTDNLTLIGAGSTATVIDGSVLPSVLEVRDGATLDLGWLTLRSTEEVPAVFSSGELVEIADVRFESVAEGRPVDASDDSSPSESGVTTVADLNADRAQTAVASAVNKRQDTLLAEILSRQSPAAGQPQLIIPRQESAPQVNSPLDAMLGITNPQPSGTEPAVRYEDVVTPQIARSADEEVDRQKQTPDQRQEDVINSLFEVPLGSGDDEIQPAAVVAPVSGQETERNFKPVFEDAAVPNEEPQPLFPEIDIPPIETELPVIPGVAPFLPDLESDLPEIQVDEAATTQSRSAFLPMLLGGLLTSAVRYQSTTKRRREVQNGRVDTKWATRVEALI